MIPLSTTAAIAWQPTWATGDDHPVFYYRGASVIEREAFEAEAAGHRAQRVFPWDLGAKFFEGLQALLSEMPEEIDRLVAQREELLNSGVPDPALKAEIDQVHDALVQYYPPYRLLVEQEARRQALVPILAVQRFCTGWERHSDGGGQPVAFRRDMAGNVPDDLLQTFPSVTLRAFGLEIYNNLYAVGAEKNSAPPSKSGSGQRTSRRAAGRGKSTRTNGPKTQR